MIRALQNGGFIRVKSDNEFRPGIDGMIIDYDSASETVGLIFGYDRYNDMQYVNGHRVICVGPEAWSLDELDMSSLEPMSKLIVG